MAHLLLAPSDLARRAAPRLAHALRAASRARGERVVHPRGRTLTGRLVVPAGATTGAALLDSPREYDVLVRQSRSLGLPEPLPDVHGLAIRVVDCYGPDLHQDLLLDSTFAPPLLRRLPVPARAPHLYSSLLSYDVGGRRALFGAHGRGDELTLLLATPHGRWSEVGRITLGAPAPEGRRIPFDPWTTGGGITPVGAIQQLRRGAYPAAHVAPDE